MSRPVTRRGSIYVIVMVTVAIVVATGLVAMERVRVHRQTSELGAEIMQARQNAASAVEFGLRTIDTDPNWRTSGSGTWIGPIAFGNGTLTLQAADPVDGNLSNSDSDPVVLTGIGTCGRATQKIRLRVDGADLALSSMEVAAWADSSIAFNASTLVSNAPIAANGPVSAVVGVVNSDVESTGLIVGATYYGTNTPLAPARDAPTVGAMNTYQTVAEPIDVATLPTSGGEHFLEGAVLTAGYSSHGASSAQGIYTIDCKGVDLVIRASRIEATLILVGPGPGSRIEGQVRLQSPTNNTPVLLVDGDISIQMDGGVLDEAFYKTNFNPVGAPYEGTDDNDILDTYPTGIDGLVYTTGTCEFDGAMITLEGCLLVGTDLTLINGAVLTLVHDPLYTTDPPEGFSNGASMTPDSDSWVQVVD